MRVGIIGSWGHMEALARHAASSGMELAFRVGRIQDLTAPALARKPDVVAVGLGRRAKPLEILGEIRKLLPDAAVLAVIFPTLGYREGFWGRLGFDGALAAGTKPPDELLARRPASGTPPWWGRAGFADLTGRELEVLSLCAGGLRNGEIAAALGIALPTAKILLRSAAGKLGVASRIEAALAARAAGIATGRAAVRGGAWGRLSPLQQRVVANLAKGRNNAEIAQTVGSTVPAVKTALVRAKRKLGLGSRLDAASVTFRGRHQDPG